MSGEEDGVYISVLEEEWDALEAENKMLRQENAYWNGGSGERYAQVVRLQNENKRLREALEQVKSGFCSHNVDGVAVWCRNCQEKVNISREALKGEE